MVFVNEAVDVRCGVIRSTRMDDLFNMLMKMCQQPFWIKETFQSQIPGAMLLGSENLDHYEGKKILVHRVDIPTELPWAIIYYEVL